MEQHGLYHFADALLRVIFHNDGNVVAHFTNVKDECEHRYVVPYLAVPHSILVVALKIQESHFYQKNKSFKSLRIACID